MAAAGSAAALMVCLAAGAAQAQTLGVGTRMMTASGEDSPLVSSTGEANPRFYGALVRFHASSHMALEVAMDYRRMLNPEGTARIRYTPIQASILFFPLRTAIAPYLVAGVGWYRQRIEAIDGGEALVSTTTSETGYHTGFGAQMKLGQHAAIFLDYRYSFVDVTGSSGLAGAAYAATSLSSVVNLLNAASGNAFTSKLEHRGRMWTTGMAIYF
jgi:opacity protein-like surface antigen